MNTNLAQKLSTKILMGWKEAYNSSSSGHIVFKLVDDQSPHYTACFLLNTLSPDPNREFSPEGSDDAFLYVLNRRDTPSTGFITSFESTNLFGLPKAKEIGTTLTLLEVQYDNVIEEVWPGNQGFLKIYFNQEFGLLGFLDEFDQLYTFDRYVP